MSATLVLGLDPASLGNPTGKDRYKRREKMSVALEKPTLKRRALPAETGISTTQTPTRDADLFSRFLELPVPVVLLTLWVVGAALMGSCALTLYHLLGLLLSAPGGP